MFLYLFSTFVFFERIFFFMSWFFLLLVRENIFSLLGKIWVCFWLRKFGNYEFGLDSNQIKSCIFAKFDSLMGIIFLVNRSFGSWFIVLVVQWRDMQGFKYFRSFECELFKLFKIFNWAYKERIEWKFCIFNAKFHAKLYIKVVFINMTTFLKF